MGDREGAMRLLIKGQETAHDKSTSNDHAYQLLASACFADPTYGAAFYANGGAAGDLLRPHASVALYRRALECERLEGLLRCQARVGTRLRDLACAEPLRRARIGVPRLPALQSER